MSVQLTFRPRRRQHKEWLIILFAAALVGMIVDVIDSRQKLKKLEAAQHVQPPTLKCECVCPKNP